MLMRIQARLLQINKNYEDMLDENSKVISNSVTIQSKVITEPFINVFIPFSENIENRIFNYNPSLKPEEDIRGLNTNISINTTFIDGTKRDSLRNEYVKTFNTIYSVKIDTTVVDTKFIFSLNKANKLGFETFVGTKQLSEGSHILRLRRIFIKDADTTYRYFANIPFWYYND